MPNIYALAAPEHLPLLVRAAVYLLVIFSVYNYLRAQYYGKIIGNISARGAVSPETATGARELDCDGILGKFFLRRRSPLRKIVLISGEARVTGNGSVAEVSGTTAVENENAADEAHKVSDETASVADKAEELNEEAEEVQLRRADKLRPEAPFNEAKFYIPESSLESALVRFCDKNFDRKGSPVSLAVGCVLLIVLCELFLHNYGVISDFILGILGGSR